MKVTTSLLALGFAARQASAFPAVLSEAMIQGRTAQEAREVKDHKMPKRQLPITTPPFDPALQYVSNQGDHKFVAPSGNDQRGPCPGLNAMANHGYLPHNGVGKMADFLNGCQAAFGMGADLAGFLAVYGAIFDGDLTQYSIGGPYPGVGLPLGLLGQPTGLSGSHNKYEGDVSPVKGDLYQYGNSYLNQMSQFKALYDMGQANGNSIDLAVLTNYRIQRFHESVNSNPYFFNAPFSGVIAQPAAWSFIYRFMANKSAEHPTGLLDGETLKSFFAVTGDDPSNFKYTPGHESFPNNWYKRHPVDYYTIPYLSVDTNEMALQHPEFLTVGGNTGKPDSFVGIDPGDLTYGTYNSDSILQGNNLICYGLEASLMEAPDFLSGLYQDINPAMDKLGAAINQATNGLGCQKLNKINKDQLNQYPGYTKLKKDGTY